MFGRSKKLYNTIDALQSHNQELIDEINSLKNTIATLQTSLCQKNAELEKSQKFYILFQQMITETLFVTAICMLPDTIMIPCCNNGIYGKTLCIKKISSCKDKNALKQQTIPLFLSIL